jgi:hypothetical protein
LPSSYYIKQNYPDPFNLSTIIEFGLPEDTYVKLEVYNVVGAVVDVILDGMVNAGVHRVEFNSSDLPSGVYFYRFIAGDFIEVRKMIVLK